MFSSANGALGSIIGPVNSTVAGWPRHGIADPTVFVAELQEAAEWLGLNAAKAQQSASIALAFSRRHNAGR